MLLLLRHLQQSCRAAGKQTIVEGLDSNLE